MPNLTLAGATIIDGTGGPAYRGTVTVIGDTIVEIAPAGIGAGSGRIVDISDLVLAPGFIDMHSHSDLAVVSDPDHLAKVSQGVTLEVVGQDGLSYFPTTDNSLPQLVDQLEAWNGRPNDISWQSVGEYLERIDTGAPVNVACLVPHGSLRMAVMGMSDRAPTAGEFHQMEQLLGAGMQAGALGMSTGLTYVPGTYATDDELVSLCQVVRGYDGYYCTHHRNYGAQAMRAYSDSIDVAERANVKLHLAHCHLNFAENTGKAPLLIGLIDDAVARGVDITLDTYPYLAGATYLASLIPVSGQEGGVKAILARLHDQQFRSWLIHVMENVGSDGHHGMPMDWQSIVISGVAQRSLDWTVGLSIAQIAARQGLPPGEAFISILIDDELGSGCLVHVGNEDNVRAIMAHPHHTGGTDGILVGDKPHPRAWGTFPRFLGKYVREEAVLSLEECIRHLTGAAAARLGLRDRGTIRVGAKADLVMFDPQTVRDQATYSEPKQRSIGIEHVMVNGMFTLWHGNRTALLPGAAVRRPGRRLGRSFGDSVLH